MADRARSRQSRLADDLFREWADRRRTDGRGALVDALDPRTAGDPVGHRRSRGSAGRVALRARPVAARGGFRMGAVVVRGDGGGVADARAVVAARTQNRTPSRATAPHSFRVA